MKLKDLLYKVSIVKVIGTTDVEVLNIQFDSRRVVNGDLFVAISGDITDGHKYIEETILSGAKVIVVEKIPKNINNSITYIQVENSNEALGIIASNFYNNPSERIKLIGVTGTNSKTTVVSLLHQIFGLLNVKSGMLSTTHNKINDKVISSTHTTPDALQINYLLNKTNNHGI